MLQVAFTETRISSVLVGLLARTQAYLPTKRSIVRALCTLTCTPVRPNLIGTVTVSYHDTQTSHKTVSKIITKLLLFCFRLCSHALVK